MERHPNAPSWRLVGTYPEGTFCHKPSTVSGGGKSEISKSIAGAIISGAVFVDNFDKDMDMVADIFEHDYSAHFGILLITASINAGCLAINVRLLGYQTIDAVHHRVFR